MLYTTPVEKQKEIQQKFAVLKDHLNEKTRRLWCGSEALAIGASGITLVSKATNISHPTIRRGIKEIHNPETIVANRIRKEGGGRKALEKTDKTLTADIEKLIEPATRGDPESPLRWTSKSTQHIADELNKKTHRSSPRSISRMLHEMDFSLQSNSKTHEGGKENPDRDKQFEFINEKTKEFQKNNSPVLSVDTKKKENIGNFKNNGQEYHKKGKPRKVNVYDFIDKEKGKVSPYGVYDLDKNKGWVNVGISSDTAAFAVNSIRVWWHDTGKKFYKNAKEILITADCGGSNGYRVRLWKTELQKLATELDMTIHVSHFPPGTSKWNKIEHKLFCFISKNWRGRPLIDLATVVNLIGNVKTKTGLTVKAMLDKNYYEKGIKISDEEFDAVKLNQDTFHGEWNYWICP